MSSTEMPSRRSNLALIISLCVNLLLVGLIVVAFVRMHYIHPQPGFGPLAMDDRGMMGGHGHGRGHGRMLFHMQQSLTPQALLHAVPGKREKIEAIMDGHRPQIRNLGLASIQARNEAFNVFSASTFDKKAFDDSLAKVLTADTALEKEILSVVSDSAVILSPEERKAVARERDRGGHGRHFWRHRWHRDFGGPAGPGEGEN